MGLKFISTLFLPILLFIVSCTSARSSSTLETFEFSSGGAYHPSGYGEWQIKMEKDGKLSISQNLAGRVIEYGSFQLSNEQNKNLWDLIAAVDLPKLASSQRPGIPDENKYTFVIKDQSGKHRVEIWVNDSLGNDRIVALVDNIAALIESYTKQKPFLK